VKPLIAQDYVDVKIDTEEMKNGAELAKELRGKGGGIPWITIVNSDLKRLITSDAPTGNIGCPVKDKEIAWFMKMIKDTAKNLDEKEQAQIKVELVKHAKKIRNR
jgi:glutamate formiminotransferase